MFIRFFLVLFFLCTPFLSQADLLVDCSDSDSSAVISIPKPLDKIFQLNCTVFGHVITSKENLSMVYMATMQPVLIPAQLSRNPIQRNNNNYFKSIRFRELKKDEIEEKYRLIRNKLGGKDVIKFGVELTTKDNFDLKQKVYVFSNKTGYHCAPDCSINRMFVILSARDVRQLNSQQKTSLNSSVKQGYQDE